MVESVPVIFFVDFERIGGGIRVDLRGRRRQALGSLRSVLFDEGEKALLTIVLVRERDPFEGTSGG